MRTPVLAAIAAAILTSAPLTDLRAQAPGPMPVTVAAPLVKNVVEWDEYTGRFEALERVEIRARVSGFLQSVHFKDGQLVEKGQLLFVIDPRPFQAQLDQAKATLEAAKTRVSLAEREFARAENLIKRNNVSRETYDQRLAELDTARTNVQAARAQVRVAELNLEFTQVKAPIAGRVSDARLDVGNLVEGGAAQSRVLTTIVSIDPILFTFQASEGEYLKYSRLNVTGERESSRSKATPVKVRLMDEQEFRHEGAMTFVDNELSPDTGTIRAQATFPNPDGFLTPGVFGRMRLPVTEEREAILVPDEAVVSDQSRKLLLVVGKDGKVFPHQVDLGPLVNGLRIIRAGVSPGDLVIVKGLQRARPGGTVVPMQKLLNAEGKLVDMPGTGGPAGKPAGNDAPAPKPGS